MTSLRELLSANLAGALRQQGLAYDLGSANRTIMEVVAEGLAQALSQVEVQPHEHMDIKKRLDALVSALTLLGEQVAEHNRALQSLAAPPPPSKAMRHPCYCGWHVEPSHACQVCGRTYLDNELAHG